VLEGEAFRVQERFAIICADARHVDVQVRQRSDAAERQFGEHWMALRLQHEIQPQRLQDLGYQPGLPAASFSADAVLNLVRTCCQDAAAAG
jgi:hypothetical protein